jgi:plastocyanin
MRRILLVLFALIAPVNPLLAPASMTDDPPAAQVNIVEPNFQLPQAWTFDPAETTVPLSTTINWTNAGAVAHTVTADDGGSFDSGNLEPQSTFSFTTTIAGTFTYHCSFHPWMTGTITVTP